MGRLEAVLPWLPAVLALSANSPYVGGEETGLASTRAELLAPAAGGRAAGLRDYEDWARFAELLVELGLADDLMRLWWDVRPHPRLGTLEIRMPDQPTRLAATAALAELCHALVVGPTRPRRRPTAGSTPRIAGPQRGSAWAEPIHRKPAALAPTVELLARAEVGSVDLAPDEARPGGEQLEAGRADGSARCASGWSRHVRSAG